MNIQSLLTNSFYINNIKTNSLYGGYIIMGYVIIKFLNFLKNNLPDFMFYLLFSYISIRIHETMYNEKLTTLSDKFDSLLFTCSYDFIILYSKVQIIIGKISNNVIKVYILLNDMYIKDSKLESFIHNCFQIKTKKINIQDSNNNTMFEFIKNGDVINKTVSLNNNLIDEDKYDFVVLSNELTNYKKIIQKRDIVNNINNINNISMTPSNVNFRIFQLNIPFFNKHDDESLFDLHLSNAKYNFLLDNNRIDKDFLLFFINNYYSSEIVNMQHLNGCEIRLMDKNINLLSVNLDKQYIHIYENNYEVKDIIEKSNSTNNFIESEEYYESDEKEYIIAENETIESSESNNVNSEKETPDISSNNSSIESSNTDN